LQSSGGSVYDDGFSSRRRRLNLVVCPIEIDSHKATLNLNREMHHRSFRLSPDRRIGGRVIPRLRLVHACVVCVYLLLAIAFLGLAAVVAFRTEFFTDGQPNWLVLVAFSVLVALGGASVQSWAFDTARRISSKFLIGRWMTPEQAERLPRLYDAWPDCWLESSNQTQDNG
jgi:hypothetical protein